MLFVFDYGDEWLFTVELIARTHAVSGCLLAGFGEFRCDARTFPAERPRDIFADVVEQLVALGECLIARPVCWSVRTAVRRRRCRWS
jgi:hypothetical protein